MQKDIAKWIVDINNKISVMFGKCIMIVGIRNNVQPTAKAEVGLPSATYS